MPTFAESIPPLDVRTAAHASESDTCHRTRLSLRIGHRSERVGRRCERAVHRFPFVAMRSEDLGHPETNATMRFETRAVSSLCRSHADLFVGMSDAIEAMRYKRTTYAPRRPSALPRASRASPCVASATARARTQSLLVPRDASRLPPGVPPAPCDPSLVPRDAPPVPRDTPRVRRASPPESSDAPPALRASRRARGHPGGTPRGAPRARSDSIRVRADYFTSSETV
jgi:hypothetical protein